MQPAGLVNVYPALVYIETDNTLAEITADGYLNSAVAMGNQFDERMMALVSTKTTPTATAAQVGLFDVAYSGGNWSLTASNSTISLADAHILVGDANGVAQDVALSGDATISDVGVLSINSDILKYVEVDLTSAQLLGMYAAPVEIIPAAGADTAIVIEHVVLAQTYGTATYANGGAVGLQYDSTIHLGGEAASATIAAAAVNVAASAADMALGVLSTGAFTAIVNKGIYLSNDTAAFITGDGTFKVHAWYRVIPTV